MALIKCNDCGAQISDTAKNCPKCGAPVVKGEAKVEEKSIPETVNNNFNPQPKKKGNGLLIALIFGGVLIVGVIAFIFMNNGPSKQEIEARERTKADSIRAALEASLNEAINAAELEAAEKAEMEARAMIIADSIAAPLEGYLNEGGQE
jgi:uncharacterized membrane protein YvbJ